MMVSLVLRKAAVALVLSIAVGSTLAHGISVELSSFHEFNRLAEEREQSLPHLQQEMTVADARHLLERAGIGAHPTEIQALLGKTRSEAISVMIAQLDVSEPLLAYPAAVADAYHYNWVASDLASEQRQAFRNARDKEMSQLRQWWVREMLSTDRPAGERLMLIWHNHFVTAYSSVDGAVRAMYLQHDMLREVGFSDFRTILRSVVRDAAMLNYLDNEDNRKDSPNENLARELMELFVLGEGVYTQEDVREVARALTGNTFGEIGDYAFLFDAYEHDAGMKTILGKTGPFDADDVIDILLSQPVAAEFLSRKFWRAYVSEYNEDPQEITAIAQAFRESDYDIPTLIRSTLASVGFWDDGNRGTIVKSPVDLLVGGIRTSGRLPEWWSSLGTRMDALGQRLFEAPNVAGWPGGGEWINPFRLRLREDMLADLVDSAEVNASQPSTPTDAVAGSSGVVEIRYAAENFEGPPKLRVVGYGVVDGKRSVVWQSAPIEAKGGVDTERFGTVDNQSELPWMIETLQLPEDVGLIDQFMVWFENDHCCGPGGPQGGDRNLYLDWVRHDDRVFLASQGSKRTTCSVLNPGAMYCNGSLRLSKFQISTEMGDSGDDALSKNTLYVDRVAPRDGELRDPNSPRNSVQLMLKDVRFNDIVIHGMEIEASAINDSGRRDYILTLDENECHPTCLGGPYPPSAQYNPQLDERKVEFSLLGASNQDYDQLPEEQKAFVRALWLTLPEMFWAMRSGEHMKYAADEFREAGLDSWGGWGPDIRYLEETLPQSRYRGDYQFVLAPASDNTGMTMSMMMADSAADQEVFLLGMFGQELGSWDQHTQSMTKAEKVMSVLAQSAGVDTATDVSFETLVRMPIYQLK